MTFPRRLATQVAELETLLRQALSRIPDKSSRPSQFAVRLLPERRDCLYRIAQQDNVYGDPTQWPKLYEANKDAIDRGYGAYLRKRSASKYTRFADLLFPGQVPDIP